MSELKKLYLAHKLTQRKSISDPEKLHDSIRSANVDLNPHQVDAAVFAFKSPLSRGAILADEVGLGKTIEAGLIINQLWAEGRNHILILVPASLRTQWQDELLDKFDLESQVLDGPSFKKLQKEYDRSNPLQNSGIYIASHNFSYKYDIYCKEVIWDLVVIDEAHRLRNVWRKSNKTAKKIRESLNGRPTLLLTATPLQNNLMELFGLTSFIEENYLGTEFSFRTLYNNPVTRQKKYEYLKNLQVRLMGQINPTTGDSEGGILTRALRKQVKGLVHFTNRYSVTQDFLPNDNEIELYNLVSDYLRRPNLASTKATQRNMMELLYRKILASSSFAIAGTLSKVADFIAKRLQKEFKVSHEEATKIALEIKNEYEKKYRKNLPEIEISNVSPEEEDDVIPVFEDLELDLKDIEEEQEESDDLGEDEQFEDKPENEEKKETQQYEFTKEEVLQEFKDVLNYFYLATTIEKNQKSQSLLRILEKIFKEAEKRNWPKKAVIFTESRRTQDHLEKLLSASGYNLTLFNGSNANKRAQEIYCEWSEKFPEEAARSSKSISLRKALIWKFKELKEGILITTEAGAEGINLQFANIVINYDLPWNPQRVEQRIGRCHRYGQKLDVIVVNFLNKKNYADQRVYELLSEKIKLFGNLFDFSDKVLGTEKLTDDGYEVREVALAGLGSGLDFEKKILNIYRHCRSEEEINKSFHQLQLDLSDVIEEKVEDAQKKVIQHFDDDVRQKLKLREMQFTDSLGKYDRWLKEYIQIHYPEARFQNEQIFELNGKRYNIGRSSEENRENGIHQVHSNLEIIKNLYISDKNISGKWLVELCHDQEKKRYPYEDITQSECQMIINQLTSKRKTVNNDDEEFDELIISVIHKTPEGWKQLPYDRAQKILDLCLVEEKNNEERLRDEIFDIEKNDIKLRQETISQENQDYILQEMETMETFVQESLLRFKMEMDQREKEISDLRKQARASRIMGYHEIQQIHDEITKKEKELFKSQKKYFQAQEQRFTEKDKKSYDLKAKLQMTFGVKRLAEVKFIIKD